jgi:hypothetical protein
VIEILLIITCLLLPVKLLVSQEDYILGTQGAATSYESAMWFMFVDTFLELQRGCSKYDMEVPGPSM